MYILYLSLFLDKGLSSWVTKSWRSNCKTANRGTVHPEDVIKTWDGLPHNTASGKIKIGSHSFTNGGLTQVRLAQYHTPFRCYVRKTAAAITAVRNLEVGGQARSLDLFGHCSNSERSYNQSAQNSSFRQQCLSPANQPKASFPLALLFWDAAHRERNKNGSGK